MLIVQCKDCSKPCTKSFDVDTYNRMDRCYNCQVQFEEDLKWDDLKHGIISEINDFYSKGNKVVLKKETNKSAKQSSSDASNDIIDKINEILDTKIRPAVARDGGDITFKSFNNGIVTVELKGSCSGCPSSIMTLKRGVQNLLCHYVPEVKGVEAN